MKTREDDKPVERDEESLNDAAPVSGRIERVERDAAGRLVVRVEGCDEPLVDARVARCFPWSMPDSYVSIRDKDGKEIALLKSLSGLDGASREIVEQELRDKVFNPMIRRVVEFKTEFGVTSITAETDRGEVTFQIRTRDDVRVLSPTRALFRDVDGNTYELADVSAARPRQQEAPLPLLLDQHVDAIGIRRHHSGAKVVQNVRRRPSRCTGDPTRSRLHRSPRGSAKVLPKIVQRPHRGHIVDTPTHRSSPNFFTRTNAPRQRKPRG